MLKKIIEQDEIIKGMQENENSAIKYMKQYEDYKLRIDKAIEQLEKLKNLYDDNYTISDKATDIIEILKGEDKE